MKSIGMQVRMSISCLWEINVILPQEGWSAIRLEGIPFLETSAKNATNVEEAFMTMASEKRRTASQPVMNTGKSGTVNVGGSQPIPPKTGWCS